MTNSKIFSTAQKTFCGITLFFVYDHFVGLASQFRSKTAQTRKINKLTREGYREQGR